MRVKPSNRISSLLVKIEYMKFAYTAACISDIRILDIKVAVLLMMDLVAVAATQTSGYCHVIPWSLDHGIMGCIYH